MSWPVTHGKRYTRVYQAWVDMVRRCGNPERDGYIHYGGRGISVCPTWIRFENFYADMGDPPEGMTIERIDNDGNYEKLNCRWATNAEQMLNRTCSRFLVVDGERMIMAVASRRYGISVTALKARLDSGWPDEKAVKAPVRTMAKRSEWRRKCA